MLRRMGNFSCRLGRSVYGAMPLHFIRKTDSERVRVAQYHRIRKEMETVPADGSGKARITPRAPRWGYLQWGLKLLMVATMVSRVEAGKAVRVTYEVKIGSDIYDFNRATTQGERGAFALNEIETIVFKHQADVCGVAPDAWTSTMSAGQGVLINGISQIVTSTIKVEFLWHNVSRHNVGGSTRKLKAELEAAVHHLYQDRLLHELALRKWLREGTGLTGCPAHFTRGWIGIDKEATDRELIARKTFGSETELFIRDATVRRDSGKYDSGAYTFDTGTSGKLKIADKTQFECKKILNRSEWE